MATPVRGAHGARFDARLRDVAKRRASYHTSSYSLTARSTSSVRRRAIDDARDVVVVTGALERLAQTCAVALKEDDERRDICAWLPRRAFEGVKNPFDARATELKYPNENALKLMTNAGVGLANAEEEEVARACARRATMIVFADENSKELRASVERWMTYIDRGEAKNVRRIVVVSRVGVERRSEEPWRYVNRKTFRGGAPLDDCFEAERAVRARAVAKVQTSGKQSGFTYTMVRVGELRGNGPTSVVYGDYALTLVDNAFDVRMQDIAVERGDTFGQEFTKRASAAAFANRMLTTSRYDVLNAAFSVVSVGPVPRERRMGYDVAKGRSPPPVSDREIDEALAPDDGDVETAPEGAPAPA